MKTICDYCHLEIPKDNTLVKCQDCDKVFCSAICAGKHYMDECEGEKSS